VVGGERIDRVGPASLLAAKVAGRIATHRRGTPTMVSAESSGCCTSAALAVAPCRETAAAEAGSR
jgi:hypothetical protein